MEGEECSISKNIWDVELVQLFLSCSARLKAFHIVVN